MKLMLLIALGLLACVATLASRRRPRTSRGVAGRPGFIYESTAARSPLSMTALLGLAMVWVMALAIVVAQA